MVLLITDSSDLLDNNMHRYLIIDGQLHGTGIRDKVSGGYVTTDDLKTSESLVKRLHKWLEAYEHEHYNGYEDDYRVVMLDQEGIAIAKSMMLELPNSKIEYYSAANLATIPIPNSR